MSNKTLALSERATQLTDLGDQLLVRFSGHWAAQAGSAIALLYYGIFGTPEEKAMAAGATVARELANWKATNYTGRQLATMVEAYEERLQELAEQKANHSYFRSDEHACLVANIIEASTRNSSEAKLRLFGRLLAGSLTSKSTLQADDARATLERLSGLEVKIAAACFRIGSNWGNFQQESERESATGETKRFLTAELLAPELPNLAPDLIPAFLQRLQREGLIQEPAGMIIDYFGGWYYVTDYFREVAELLGLETNPQPGYQ